MADIGGGANDYADLNAWEAALPGTLSGDEIAECYGGANLVSANLDLSGYTMGGNRLIIRAASGESWVDGSPPTWDTAKAYASRGAFGGWLNIGVDCTIEGIQLESTYVGGSSTIADVVGAIDVQGHKLWIKGPDGAAGDHTDGFGFLFGGNASQRGRFSNCVGQGWNFASNTGDERVSPFSAFGMGTDKSVRMYHCTFVDCVVPGHGNGNHVMINCISQDSAGGWHAGTGFTDGASGWLSSNDATSTVRNDGENNQTFAFRDLGNLDLRLDESRPGTDVSTDPVTDIASFGLDVTEDALGVTRTEWTRGAFEYVSGGGGGGGGGGATVKKILWNML